MTIIVCDYFDCIHRSANGICDARQIYLVEDGLCSEYASYRSLPEYQHDFFRAERYTSELTGATKVYKRADKGKRLEFDGYVFYTTNDTRKGAPENMTEEKTGYLVPGDLFTNPKRKENLSAFIRKMQSGEIPNINTLPDFPYEEIF